MTDWIHFRTTVVTVEGRKRTHAKPLTISSNTEGTWNPKTETLTFDGEDAFLFIEIGSGLINKVGGTVMNEWKAGVRWLQVRRKGSFHCCTTYVWVKFLIFDGAAWADRSVGSAFAETVSEVSWCRRDDFCFFDRFEYLWECENAFENSIDRLAPLPRVLGFCSFPQITVSREWVIFISCAHFLCAAACICMYVLPSSPKLQQSRNESWVIVPTTYVLETRWFLRENNTKKFFSSSPCNGYTTQYRFKSTVVMTRRWFLQIRSVSDCKRQPSRIGWFSLSGSAGSALLLRRSSKWQSRPTP